jgi:hypothetical protein
MNHAHSSAATGFFKAAKPETPVTRIGKDMLGSIRLVFSHLWRGGAGLSALPDRLFGRR